MYEGSQRGSYECSEILDSREAVVIESLAVAVSWRKITRWTWGIFLMGNSDCSPGL